MEGFLNVSEALKELMNDVYPHKTKKCRKLRDVYHEAYPNEPSPFPGGYEPSLEEMFGELMKGE